MVVKATRHRMKLPGVRVLRAEETEGLWEIPSLTKWIRGGRACEGDVGGIRRDMGGIRRDYPIGQEFQEAKGVL